MASISRKTGIIGALVIAGVLIVGSVILSNGGFSFLDPSVANAASTQALLQALASREHDGLPDWEAELYGLDPKNIHSFSPTITNAQAIAEGLVKPKFLIQTATSTDATSTDDDLPGITAAPGSLTEQFSQTLLTQYLQQSATDVQNGTTPSDSEVMTLAQSAMQTFALQQEHQDVYTLGQVQVGGTGPDAMKQYAVAAEAVFAANNPNADDTSESELDYFSDAVEKNDPTALVQVAKIAKSYSALGPALMKLQVPTEAQNAHLEIANAAARLGADITDLSMMNNDPLRAYLGLAQYQIDVVSIAKGFSDMGSVFSAENVSIPQGDPGYYFYSLTTSGSRSSNKN
jgi:hypothetical protein